MGVWVFPVLGGLQVLGTPKPHSFLQKWNKQAEKTFPHNVVQDTDLLISVNGIGPGECVDEINAMLKELEDSSKLRIIGVLAGRRSCPSWAAPEAPPDPWPTRTIPAPQILLDALVRPALEAVHVPC